MIKQVDIHSRGKCQAWLGPLARRFLTYIKETKKCGLTVLWKADKCSLEVGRSCTRWVSSVEPWQGGREGRPGRRPVRWPPTGSTLLPAVVGNTKRRGWGGRPWPLSLQRSDHWPQTIIVFNELQLVRLWSWGRAWALRILFLKSFDSMIRKTKSLWAENNSQGHQPPVVVTSPSFQQQLNDEDYKMWKTRSPRRQWHSGGRQGKWYRGFGWSQLAPLADITCNCKKQRKRREQLTGGPLRNLSLLELSHYTDIKRWCGMYHSVAIDLSTLLQLIRTATWNRELEDL